MWVIWLQQTADVTMFEVHLLRLDMYLSTGKLSSCFFYSGRFNFLMQLQFLALVELFLSSLRVTFFGPGGINIF